MCIRHHRVDCCLMVCVITLAAMGALGDPNPPTLQSDQGAWPIRRQWTTAEVQHYAKWVEHLFDMKTRGSAEQRAAKIERMMADPEMNLLEQPDFLGEGGNPQVPAETLHMVHSIIDCGKFTAFMPAYYACRRALPWMTASVASGGGDIRLAGCNYPAGGVNSFTAESVEEYFQQAIPGFSTGNFRVNLHGRNCQQSDTLPVAISREFLLPGCAGYVNGHALLVAKVTEYGEVRFLDASTVTTRDIFTYNGMNAIYGITAPGAGSKEEWDGCYCGLRVLRYPLAETDAAGKVTSVRRRTNEEMKEFGFSTEQYERVRDILDRHYIESNGVRVQSLHDFIRLRLMSVDTIYPIRFMAQYATELMDAFRTREASVQAAWKEVQEHGPVVYPEKQNQENIFNAQGRWGQWSSAYSDIDLRNKYFYLADWCDFAIRMYEANPKSVAFPGFKRLGISTQEGLARLLLDSKNRLFANRSMSYTNSKGEMVALSLLDVEARLYDLSFDPNHPPELRWGAPDGSPELATAPESPTPVPKGAPVAMQEAYRLQCFYRSLGQFETEMSHLQGMFTEGFPIRPKFEEQLAKWSGFDRPVTAKAGF